MNICLDYYDNDLAHIYQIIFRLPLRYLTFEILDHDPLNSTLPIATNESYLDGDRWERLISHNMPALKKVLLLLYEFYYRRFSNQSVYFTILDL